MRLWVAVEIHCLNVSKKKKEEDYSTDAGKIVIARNEFPPLTAPSLHLIHKSALDGKQGSEADESDKANTNNFSESDVPKGKTHMLFHLIKVVREIVILATETV